MMGIFLYNYFYQSKMLINLMRFAIGSIDINIRIYGGIFEHAQCAFLCTLFQYFIAHIFIDWFISLMVDIYTYIYSKNLNE